MFVSYLHLSNQHTLIIQGIIDRLKGARELTIKRLYKLVLRKALGSFLAGQLGVEVRKGLIP